MNLAYNYNEVQEFENYIYGGIAFHRSIPIQAAKELLNHIHDAENCSLKHSDITSCERFRIIFEAAPAKGMVINRFCQVIGYLFVKDKIVDIRGHRRYGNKKKSGESSRKARHARGRLIQRLYAHHGVPSHSFLSSSTDYSNSYLLRVVYIGADRKGASPILSREVDYDLSPLFEVKDGLNCRSKTHLEERCSS